MLEPACAFALLQKHLVREIVLIGDGPTHVQGEAMDLQQAVPLGTPITVTAGTYKDAAASALVIVTVGTPGKFQGSRLDMLIGNVVIVRECIAKLMAEGFDGIIIIATNPSTCSPTSSRWSQAFLPIASSAPARCSTPSVRATSLGSNSTSTRAPSTTVIGEHGDSSVAVWSAAQAAGLPLRLYPGAEALPSHEDLLIAVHYAGPVVASLKGNTCYCPGRIFRRVTRMERTWGDCMTESRSGTL
jgi:L-lactate dehydrogenase